MIEGVRVGHASDTEARTGCTVLLGPFRAAVDVRGLAAGTRELEALSPLHLVPSVDAILLTGGSAFGLAAADGVMQWLEAKGGGFDTGTARVPIVPAAVIYDLGVGRADRRPDAAMGRAACEAAASGLAVEGRVGVGTGATVGKIRGPTGAMPGGVGSAAVAEGEWEVSALAAVNAFGDVVDGRGQILAGARDAEGGWLDTANAIVSGALRDEVRGIAGRAPPGTHTTLAVVATNAPLTRTGLQSLARSAASGVPRRIIPVHTPFDGDVVFALSTAAETRELDPGFLLMLGTMGADALARAIERAVAEHGATTG